MADVAAPEPVSAQPDTAIERDQASSTTNNAATKNDVVMEDAPVGESAPSTEGPTQNGQDHETKDASPAKTTDVNGNGVTATPQSSSKQQKRKSVNGTPSSKKLQRKKSMPDMHLDVEPGQPWFVRMKGFTAWPAIICDEDMLPLSLLEKRPVSAMRPDGTWREDFREGGKNVRERRYPVLFLGTYEFGWQVNTELMPLDVDEVKAQVERGDQGKKSKALWSAFQVAAEGHDLAWFKELLEEHETQRKAAEQAAIEAEEARIAAEEEKKAKKESKKKSKSTDDDGDVEMEDAEGGSEKKKSKKRKKEDGETDTPKQKTKIVLKGLKSSGEDGGEPKSKKVKKSKSSDGPEEDKKPSEPQLSPEEQLKRREKHVLFLRHKLQKGLVSKDNPAKAEEMPSMNEHLTALETFQDLEPSVIRETKVAKLIKVILKLESIPRDDEFKFKDRCTKLLAGWTAILSSDDVKRDEAKDKPAEPTTNGSVPAEKTEDVKVVEPDATAAAENTAPKDEPKSVEAAA